MRLSAREFAAMNHGLRRLCQRRLEMPLFRQIGLHGAGRAILEVGCGSGYGALLLQDIAPSRYHGVDLMPAQIAIARRRRLAGCTFSVADAADLAGFADGAWDTVVIFGVLHHMPGWRTALRECHRVLREGGEIFVEDPGAGAIRQFDRLFHYGHHPDAGFSLTELEAAAEATGFRIERALRLGPVAWYRWRRERGGSRSFQ